jgi:uncharacterized protein
MTLKEQLNTHLHEAMRSGDERRRTTLRMVLAAIRNAEIAPSQGLAEEAESDSDIVAIEAIPRQDLTDEQVEALLRKEVKQRRDSIDAFRKGNRQDLIDKEQAEIEILQVYLPAQMSREEIEVVAREVVAETGATGPGDKNKVMPVLMKRLAGKAEGRTINEVVTELLAGR